MLVITNFKSVRHYKTVRSALNHNFYDLIRYQGTIYKGFGWLSGYRVLERFMDDPCKLSWDNGIWNLEVK